MGGLGLLAAAAVAAGQTLPLHANWDPPESLMFLATEDDQDAPVDVVRYFDGEDVFIFVAGTVTTGAGGRIFALQRYNGDDPDEDATDPVFFPSGLANETRDHLAAAMAVDVDTGDIYIAGYTTKSNSTTDYRIVKYNKSLVLQTSWGTNGAVDWDGGEGDDKAVDIAVHGSGNAKRIFVTGNSYGGSTHLDDIVTLALYPDDGDVDWSDRYQGGTAGVQIATELVIVGTAGQENGGYAPVVGGSTWAGAENGFDIVAIGYYVVENTPQRNWVRTWNGPASEHDFCTGVAAHPQTPTTAQPVALCGITPAVPSYPNDWDYVVLALNTANGADWWSSGPAQVWAPEGTEEGSPDITADIVLRDVDPIEAWVTGSVELDSRREVGTIAYTLEGSAPAELVYSNTFNSSSSGNADNYGVAIKTGELESGLVYVTGWAQSTTALPIFLTIEYFITDPLEVNAFSGFDGEELENKATALWVHGDEVYVVGYSVSESHGGQDWINMRYDP